MGYYTEFKFKATLSQSTPEEVVSVLKRVIIERDLEVDKTFFHHNEVFKPNLEHPFFKCERWYMLFLSNNWDTTKKGGKMYKQHGRWVIELDTEFKNYDNEIDQFFDWIKPFIVGRKKKQYVGCYRGESQNTQENLYIERSSSLILSP